MESRWEQLVYASNQNEDEETSTSGYINGGGDIFIKDLRVADPKRGDALHRAISSGKF